MSIIDLTKNDIWSEADILAHGREVINSVVSTPRQDELRTIMLGHIAGMRIASTDELAEISLVASTTEQQVLDNAAARADMVLLLEVMAFEEDPERGASLEAQAVYNLRHPVIVETLEPV